MGLSGCLRPTALVDAASVLAPEVRQTVAHGVSRGMACGTKRAPVGAAEPQPQRILSLLRGYLIATAEGGSKAPEDYSMKPR